MRNYILLPIIAIILFGCGGGQGGPNIGDPFIGGNTAANLYFQNGAPPPTIYDGGKSPFGVNVVLENVGEADMGPGTDNPYVSARLEGILPSNFGVTDADLQQNLQEQLPGAHKNFDGTIQGGQLANFVFPTLNFQSRLQGNQQFTVRGVVCYDYSNTATTQVCMKSDILENVQDSTICITHVIQNPIAANKIQLNFQVEHIGPGEFFGRERGNQEEICDPSVRNSNKYNVDLEVTAQDPQSVIRCNRLGMGATGNITMYNGAPQVITCTVERSTNTSARIYTDTLTIRSAYRYGQFIEQPIIIQSVPQ
jgi:hypothetical protein